MGTFRLIALSSVTNTCGSLDAVRIGSTSIGSAGGDSAAGSTVGVRLPLFSPAISIEVRGLGVVALEGTGRSDDNLSGRFPVGNDVCF